MNGRSGTVLMVHNRYRHRGGEDVVFEAECDLLERYGHNVHRVLFENSTISDQNTKGSSIRLAASTVWSRRAAAHLHDEVKRYRPSVVHFHNTFPLVSPSGYHAVRHSGVRVVQTLHNYRVICPSAELYRNKRPCEDCVGRVFQWPGVRHKCYRASRGPTAVVAGMNFAHRLYGTWQTAIDRYIALTEFSRRKFIEGGLPENKIVVKPNFLDPAPTPKDNLGNTLLFVGRLAESKGVNLLAEAWQSSDLEIPLQVVGGGPLIPTVVNLAENNPAVDYTGPLSGQEVIEKMRTARALIFPSTWYEGFPMTLIEAFACGLPVIASRHGAMAEVIDDGRTGMLFSPGEASDLASKAQWAWEHPDALFRMGSAARVEFEEKYAGARNYEQLLRIYGWECPSYTWERNR